MSARTDGLLERIQQLEVELSQMTASRNWWKDCHEEARLVHERTDLMLNSALNLAHSHQKRIERLEAVLREYANKDNWSYAYNPHVLPEHVDLWVKSVYPNGWELAQEALEEK